MSEFELTNNNCLWILTVYEVHKNYCKENKGGRKSYDNKKWHCHMKLDRKRKKRIERYYWIATHLSLFWPKTKHTPIHISWKDEQFFRRVKARTIKNIIKNSVIKSRIPSIVLEG